MVEKTLHIGLFGLGTVGSGIIELLKKKDKTLSDHRFVLEKVVVRDITKKRDVSVPPGILSSDPRDILDNPDIDTVIEVIGGVDPARDFVLQALQQGKNVITANKLLLASSGSSIFRKAATNNCYLGVRASNIAAYRLIESLSSSPSKIEKLVGIFNGTCNYILTEMEKREESLSTVLRKAQELGYAEANPAEDVNGHDTAHKLIVLLGLTLGYFPPLECIYVEGIRSISIQDILFARELGYRIKLLAITRKRGNVLEARVHPALVPRDKGLARVEGIENEVEIRDEMGLEIGMQAPGAGKYPTATAIIEDLINIARGGKLFLPLNPFSLSLKQMGKIETKYYLKFYAVDKAGVLAKIANVLGEYNISIESVIQKGKDENKNNLVPIIMLTHLSREENIQKALSKINGLSVVGETPFLIRVEEGIF